MPQDSATAVGTVRISVIRDGVEIARREGHNTIVQNGFKLLAHRIWADTTPKRVQYMQLGHCGTAPATNQVGILTPLSAAALAGRQTVVSITMSGSRTAKWEHTWLTGDFSATGLEEVALFNAKTTSTGTMFSRFKFTLINKSYADSLRVVWLAKIS